MFRYKFSYKSVRRRNMSVDEYIVRHKTLYAGESKHENCNFIIRYNCYRCRSYYSGY